MQEGGPSTSGSGEPASTSSPDGYRREYQSFGSQVRRGHMAFCVGYFMDMHTPVQFAHTHEHAYLHTYIHTHTCIHACAHGTCMHTWQGVRGSSLGLAHEHVQGLAFTDHGMASAPARVCVVVLACLMSGD